MDFIHTSTCPFSSQTLSRIMNKQFTWPALDEDNRTGKSGYREINSIKAPIGMSINRLPIRLIFSLRNVHHLIALLRTFYFKYKIKATRKYSREKGRDSRRGQNAEMIHSPMGFLRGQRNIRCLTWTHRKGRSTVDVLSTVCCILIWDFFSIRIWLQVCVGVT